MDIVQVERATKTYGEHPVLNDVSLSLAEGLIHGIVGRNGSGKTILLKAICGFVPLSAGRIIVRGLQIGKDIDAPADVGIIIEAPGFLPNYSAYHNLRFLAKIQNRIGRQEIEEAIAAVGLDPTSKKHVGKYSLGMRQRLGIAQAIMENPSLLVLDEPFNGLDISGVEEMRTLLLGLREQGKTILLASHSPEDIGLLCDTVHKMDDGRIIEGGCDPDPKNASQP
jgi:ABC-2 type transport system ATP-binding protein